MLTSFESSVFIALLHFPVLTGLADPWLLAGPTHAALVFSDLGYETLCTHDSRHDAELGFSE